MHTVNFYLNLKKNYLRYVRIWIFSSVLSGLQSITVVSKNVFHLKIQRFSTF